PFYFASRTAESYLDACLHCIQIDSHVNASYHVVFFNATAATEIYTLSLHDALPILRRAPLAAQHRPEVGAGRLIAGLQAERLAEDRKSTRLNSSHVSISYAVFCLKKKSLTFCFFSLDLFVFYCILYFSCCVWL